MSVDLRVSYLGLSLRSPLIAGAAPHNDEPAYAARLEAAGAGAIVLPSLFEEEIEAEALELTRSLEQGSEAFSEALDYFPTVDAIVDSADRYAAALERVKRSVGIPVIASLNAISTGTWTAYARRLADAGADALELNVYRVAAHPTRTAADVEAADLEIVAAVRGAITIPLVVKLSPYYSAFANFAARVTAAGADGLVIFNRFYQPDLGVDSLEVVPHHELSHHFDLRLPLRWLAILRPQLGASVSLAASSGVHSGIDAVKAVAVGADAVQLTSALLRLGPDHLQTVEADLRAWLAEHGYERVADLRGVASVAIATNASAVERANYMREIRSWSTPAPLEAGASSSSAVSDTQPR